MRLVGIPQYKGDKMKIVTISREFGSGGREIGKRLADELGFDYYDKEIISAIAKNENLDEQYVNETIHSSFTKNFQYTFNHSFFDPLSLNVTQARLLIEQKKIIEGIAKKGKDAIIVGRNADYILRGYKPFKLFVCASQASKIERCKERGEGSDNLSDKEIEKYINKIDRVRKETCAIVAGNTWGDRRHYNLIVNTTDADLKKLAELLSIYIKAYFDKT